MGSSKCIKRSSESLHDIAGDVVRLLKQAQETVGVAESLTGGSIMAALTSIEGASPVIRGGIVSYLTGLKVSTLKVDRDLISRHGVVHGEVAQQMAAGARKATALDTPTTWGLSSTGIAGPDPQDGKAPGTVFIGISTEGKDRAFGPYQFSGGRDDVRQATVMEALSQLRNSVAEGVNADD
ncbi:competence-damage inducible [Fusarium heterosporum]|uniref:Competence-damage inducible n=1 Tax=Fusarium heterosporum TaxID=42747 RepID=A0A8H5T6L9_FUSHE|nr:competence-damage inducible [Fusarium heterosporum]